MQFALIPDLKKSIIEIIFMVLETKIETILPFLDWNLVLGTYVNSADQVRIL